MCVQNEAPRARRLLGRRRIPLVQAPTSSSEAARLASETKEQRERRLQLRRAVKHENVVSKVVVLNKQVRKHRSSKLNSSEMPADVSVKQPHTRLAGCWIKAKLMFAAMKMKQQQFGNQRQSTYTTNIVFRDDVSKNEKDLNVKPCICVNSRFDFQ